MKTLVTLLTLALASTFSATAQPQTILTGDVEHGGFGGPMVQVTQFNDQLGVMFGGGGGWILGHTLYLGGGGYGLVTDLDAPSVAGDSSHYLNIGYGGVMLGYIYRSDDLVHFTVNALIGGGGVHYQHQPISTGDGGISAEHPNDAFFVFEPSINAELNIASFCRLTIGGGYRMVYGIELPGLDNSKISGPSGSVMLKFGHF